MINFFLSVVKEKKNVMPKEAVIVVVHFDCLKLLRKMNVFVISHDVAGCELARELENVSL